MTCGLASVAIASGTGFDTASASPDDCSDVEQPASAANAPAVIAAPPMRKPRLDNEYELVNWLLFMLVPSPFPQKPD